MMLLVDQFGWIEKRYGHNILTMSFWRRIANIQEFMPYFTLYM
jgi:hypothetical protein